MLTNFTPTKTLAGLAFFLNFVLLFGIGEYPEQIVKAQDMVASLAILDMAGWLAGLNLPMIIFFEYMAYGLIFLLFAAYILIFFGFKIGKWFLLLLILITLPLSLTMGGVVYTMAEEPINIAVNMLDGCLIYLLFFSKNANDTSSSVK